jgi:hypothetical protein
MPKEKSKFLVRCTIITKFETACLPEKSIQTLANGFLLRENKFRNHIGIKRKEKRLLIVVIQGRCQETP